MLAPQRSPETSEDILTLQDVFKSFGGTEVLSGINIGFRRGEIHALVGENGAGKSTVGKIAGGYYKRSSGAIMLDGQPVTRWDPPSALEAGVAIMHQELQIVPALSVAQNVFLGLETSRGGLLKRDEAARMAQVDRICGFNLDPDRRAGSLPIADQQKIEIMRALARQARVIVLDEPTSSLTLDEIDRLHQTMRRLRDDGHTLIYVTHFLDHVLEVCDRITVLRDGKLVSTGPASDHDKASLVGAMLGTSSTEISYPALPPQPPLTNPLLAVKDLCVSPRVKNVSINVARGEIVGLVGLVGSGRSEIARAIFGADPATGDVTFDGISYDSRSPQRSIARGIAFVPEDRRGQGLVMSNPVRPNVSLASLKSYARFGLMRRKKERRNIVEKVSQFAVKGGGGNDDLRVYSGGNQQKVLLAKWQTINPDLIILDEPSRGVDVGARQHIHQWIVSQAQAGRSVLLISSETEEVLGLSHRAYLVHDGRILNEVDPRKTNVEEVLQTLFHAQDHT